MSRPAPVPDAAPPAERPAPVAQATPGTAAAADRWSEMARELAACDEKNALTRVFCVDRVRWRYCTDDWNKVPQCRVTGLKP